MRTITADVIAFLNEYQAEHHTPQSMLEEKPEEAVGHMTFYSKLLDGWTKVGKATITVTFDDDNEIVGSMIAALKEEQKRVLADAEVKSNAIEAKIQSLLAIEYKPE